MDELMRLFTLLRLEVGLQFTMKSSMMMDIMNLSESDEIDDKSMEVSHWIFNVMMALNDAWVECPDSLVAIEVTINNDGTNRKE